MKRFLALALVGVIGSMATLSAIPDVVGTFLIGTSSRVEDFALSPDTWIEETFSGEWETKSVEDTEEEEEIYQLKRAFVVFGVEAEKVNAVKRNGDLQRFLVIYRPDEKRKKTADEIVKTLQRNIEAYTGENLVASAANAVTAAGYLCRYKEFEIYLGKRQPDQVLVAIQRVTN